jgi:hypothetical protein
MSPAKPIDHIAQFVADLRADTYLSDVAEGISRGLDEIDRAADFNSDFAAFFECVQWVLKRPKPIREKLDVIGRLMELQGKVTVNMRQFTGWSE